MFYRSEFDQDISKWKTSNAITMSHMFFSSQFDQDISQWDVSKVEDMNSTFEQSEFNQDLSDWKPLRLLHNSNTFKNSKTEKHNKKFYWSELDIESLPKAIESHQLNRRLHHELPVHGEKNNNSAKLKV
jgi:hypothetical protein